MSEWASLATERLNQVSTAIDELSTREMLVLINREDAKIAAAVECQLPNVAEAVDLVTAALREGGRLFYLGAGSSGRLGVLDAAECPPTFGTDPGMVQGLIAGGSEAVFRAVEGAEDDPRRGALDLDTRKAGRGDVVIGIAASGVTPYVFGGLARARELGCGTILLTCSESPKVREAGADVEVVLDVGAEVIAGSTRMKSGTATKMVLNMISTGAMIGLGKTYGNLMVDLLPTNKKLVDRSHRILHSLAGLDADQAARQLEAADGRLKVALVMALAGIEAEAADVMLERNQGSVKRAVAATTDDGAVP